MGQGPLERARHYHALMQAGLTATEAAKAVGVSRAGLFTTMRLLTLIPAAKAALRRGRLLPVSAMRLAQVQPATAQARALRGILALGDDGPPPLRAVERLLREEYLDAPRRKPRLEVYRLHLPAELLRAARRAAKREGVGLAEWWRRVARRATGHNKG